MKSVGCLSLFLLLVAAFIAGNDAATANGTNATVATSVDATMTTGPALTLTPTPTPTPVRMTPIPSVTATENATKMMSNGTTSSPTKGNGAVELYPLVFLLFAGLFGLAILL
eukprot:m.306753 g.306753  ORF g.306753 m.306753 type:complete len:112 (+) comp41561_c0_seq1:62-397(+)